MKRGTRFVLVLGSAFAGACDKANPDQGTARTTSTGVSVAPPTPSAGLAPTAGAEVLLFVTSSETPSAGAVKVGCDSYLAPIRVRVAGDDKRTQLENAMKRLVAEAGEKVTVSGVLAQPDGSFVVDLRGPFDFGGVCDVPRKLGRFEQTAKGFGTVRFTLDGSASKYRCLGDESGNCK